jgi:hypothetical protein
MNIGFVYCGHMQRREDLMASWFGGRICGSMLAMAVLVGSAHGQGGDKADVSPPAPSSQAVTLTDLKGANIHATLVTEMLALRQDKKYPATQSIDWQISIEPDARIRLAFRPTTQTPRGTRTAPARSVTVKLDEPWSTDNGEAVMQFKDGDLTFMRSYEGGAVKTVISFKQDGQNVTCSASSVWARDQARAVSC